MIDACRIGLCDLYATGGQALGLILGGTIGALLIAVFLRRAKRNDRAQRRIARRDAEREKSQSDLPRTDLSGLATGLAINFGPGLLVAAIIALLLAASN